jgi:hypothetical protein
MASATLPQPWPRSNASPVRGAEAGTGRDAVANGGSSRAGRLSRVLPGSETTAPRTPARHATMAIMAQAPWDAEHTVRSHTSGRALAQSVASRVRLALAGHMQDSAAWESARGPLTERDLLLFSPRQQQLLVTASRKRTATNRPNPVPPRGMSSQVRENPLHVRIHADGLVRLIAGVPGSDVASLRLSRDLGTCS